MKTINNVFRQVNSRAGNWKLHITNKKSAVRGFAHLYAIIGLITTRGISLPLMVSVRRCLFHSYVLYCMYIQYIHTVPSTIPSTIHVVRITYIKAVDTAAMKSREPANDDIKLEDHIPPRACESLITPLGCVPVSL